MQQLLVTVLAVHLMSVVAGPGRAGAAPVQQQPPSTSTPPSAEGRPSSPHMPGRHHHHGGRASSRLTPWTEKQLMSADSRRERSLGVYVHANHQKFLTSKHGWTLEILPNGSVTATREPKPKFGILQTEGVDPGHLGLPSAADTHYTVNSTSPHHLQQYGKVAILGYHSSRYLCMGKNGHMYTRHREEQVRQFSQECVFVESMHQHYFNSYCSFKFPRARRRSGVLRRPKRKWCLGINPNGTVRLGKRTKERHSFAQFTPRQAKPPESTPFPLPPMETTHPVRKSTTKPPVVGPKTTESPPRTSPRSPRKKKCNGPDNLFNIRCRDNGDLISDVTQLKRRKSSRRGSRGRSRKGKRRRKDRRKPSRVGTRGGLFTGEGATQRP